LRLFSFGGNGLAVAALALLVFGAIKCPPNHCIECENMTNLSVAEFVAHPLENPEDWNAETKTKLEIFFLLSKKNA